MAISEFSSHPILTTAGIIITHHRFYDTLHYAWSFMTLTSDHSGHAHTGINLAGIIDARMVKRGSAGWRDRECGWGSRNVDWSGT